MIHTLAAGQNGCKTVLGGILYLRWTMGFAERFLLMLLVIAAFASTLGYDPLALLLPGLGGYILPGVLALGLLLLIVRRSQRLEQQMAQVLEDLEAARQQHHTVVAQFAALGPQTAQRAAAVQHMQQSLAQNELLLPGRLLLLQRRHEEAMKVFQEAVAAHPESQEAHWLLGESLLEAKRYVEALPHLLTGLAEHNVRRLTLVAQCEQALGRYAEAEGHLLRLIELRGEARQEDLVTLGAVQSEVEPARARETLTQALALNPYNSVARYQLIELEIRTGTYERAIDLATEGLHRNPADVGCCVSRAEAYFRRGSPEDETRILDDLATAQVKNRKDYNIYRLRGALYQRRASRMTVAAESQRALQQALEAYEDGLANVPPKFHAHLLAAESRVLLQLKRFEDAAARAQRAVEHYPGHVSNHLALAFAKLASQQWKAAAQAADRGQQWAGWGGRVWLTAISLFANAFVGRDATALHQKCAALAADLKAADRHFALSESWEVVRTVLSEAANQAPEAWSSVVIDTIALLERTITPEQYQHKWGSTRAANEIGVA
jgi:tetratricopeptide (TPR) repeat protein